MIDREKPIWQAYDEATNAPSGRLISMREAGEGVLHGAVHVVLWRPDSESPQDGEPQILLNSVPIKSEPGVIAGR